MKNSKFKWNVCLCVFWNDLVGLHHQSGPLPWIFIMFISRSLPPDPKTTITIWRKQCEKQLMPFFLLGGVFILCERREMLDWSRQPCHTVYPLKTTEEMRNNLSHIFSPTYHQAFVCSVIYIEHIFRSCKRFNIFISYHLLHLPDSPICKCPAE